MVQKDYWSKGKRGLSYMGEGIKDICCALCAKNTV